MKDSYRRDGKPQQLALPQIANRGGYSLVISFGGIVQGTFQDEHFLRYLCKAQATPAGAHQSTNACSLDRVEYGL